MHTKNQDDEIRPDVIWITIHNESGQKLDIIDEESEKGRTITLNII